MPGDSAPRPGEAAADPARVAGAAGWLYSRPTDLFIMLAPFAATAVCAAVELSRGQGRVLERDYAAWISQFVFGNTSHVILTFLLLLVRRQQRTKQSERGASRQVSAGSTHWKSSSNKGHVFQ